MSRRQTTGGADRFRERASRNTEAGFAMLEVLIAIVISVIGILGMIGLQARTYQAEAESYQRSHALVILDDISARLSSNRIEAPAYVQNDIGAGGAEDCDTAATTAQRDLCEIGNNLRGTGEIDAGRAVGAISHARACITAPAPGTYIVAVVWAGSVPTGAPATACGMGDYGDDSLRRAATSVVVIADLDG